MSPEELYVRAGDVRRQCHPDGLQAQNAARFVEQVQAQVRLIGSWLPPAYGEEGYADGQLIDRLRQLRFHSENVLKNFPRGIETFFVMLEDFQRCILGNYHIRSESVKEV